MPKGHESITDELAEFIRGQRVFFVATAPLAAEGRVNLSPKGLDTFAVIDPKTVAYLDLTGSGIETAAHLRENGRIVVMFCAFEGPARILRLHGRGEAVESGDPRFEGLASRWPANIGTRAVIVVRVERVSTSCGWGVPLFEYKGQREKMTQWTLEKGPQGIAEYQRKNNAKSLDGLPGLRAVE